jgi:hypothetical protein
MTDPSHSAAVFMLLATNSDETYKEGKFIQYSKHLIIECSTTFYCAKGTLKE